MQDKEATFDLYVRELPLNRNYLVFVGLEDVIKYITHLRFTEEDISWIQKQFSLSEKVISYFKNFKFTGNIYAMREGTIFFPNEPMIRITGPIAQLQIIESFLFNVVGFQTLIASKIARLIHAAKPSKAGIGEQRAHGLEAGLKAVRAGYIVGTCSSALMLSFKRFNLPAMGGIATHFFVTSFPNEVDAFRAYLKTDPNGSVMVDTYNFEQGVKNIIQVAKELETEGKKLKLITIDSGDLVELWKKARKMLDENGLGYVGITAVSNLNEYKIKELKDNGANYDLFAAATEVVTSSDCPKIEIVYKLAEIKDGDEWKPKAKFATGKMSYCGRKQIFRQAKGNFYCGDILGFENENIPGEKLLEPFIINGNLVKSLPSLKEIREYTLKQYEIFSQELFSIDTQVNYPVEISKNLNAVMELLKKEVGAE